MMINTRIKLCDTPTLQWFYCFFLIFEYNRLELLLPLIERGLLFFFHFFWVSIVSFFCRYQITFTNSSFACWHRIDWSTWKSLNEKKAEETQKSRKNDILFKFCFWFAEIELVFLHSIFRCFRLFMLCIFLAETRWEREL